MRGNYFRSMHPLPASWKIVLFHALAWSIYSAYEQAVLVFTNSAQYSVWLVLLTWLLHIGLFYANSNWLLPRFYNQPHWLARYLPAVLALLTGYSFLRCELYLHLAPVLHIPTPGPVYTYSTLWVIAFYRGTFFQFVSIGYWFARNAVRVEHQKRVQEQQLLVAERSLMEANLSFLKSQINPHFLFNSLNFLYAQVYPHSENAAKGILLLSDTMRYALHEDNNGKVMLTQEIQHLHNYITLNQLRFNNQLQVKFELEGNPQFLLILPLVLITFVENCFKHGELADPKNPLLISLSVVENQLAFRTHNMKRNGPKEKSTGIGLANTCKRLDIAYAGRYELLINNEADSYACSLAIAL
jgi:hypothetical protein